MSQSLFPPPLPDPRGDGFAPFSTAPDALQGAPLQDPLLSEAQPNPFWRTIREACALFALNLLLGMTLSVLGWKFFLPSDVNSAGISEMAKRPLALLVGAVIMAPLIEELMCRGLPSFILRHLWKAQDWSTRAREDWYWVFAAASSFVFAVLHGMGDRAMQIPLPQLIMGFFLWRAAMKRGLRFSILLHATYNGIAMMLVLLSRGAIQS